ncbi:cytochrome P450 709B1-like [Zingiber officinale]|uniref:Cytochrome P450 n=1 Tax=Zingiber officinale TaxID=94328 RepID=A0A8J5FGT9_ZINOF|nr:cytochrome P450 709B1-like [Zingiber officinale]KAG6485038.1 hypothetical protein ZIOFF_053566 [Zingiber officinale]
MRNRSGIVKNSAEIIAKTSFGISEEKGNRLFKKQQMLFRSGRLFGVPFGEILCSKKSYQAWRLGKHIDRLPHDIVSSRREQGDSEAEQQHDLLRQLLEAENRDGRRRKFAARDFMDEYKTFFFTGHETTALALCWALILLALHQKWQSILREEVELVSVGRPFDSDVLSRLTKANKKI